MNRWNVLEGMTRKYGCRTPFLRPWCWRKWLLSITFHTGVTHIINDQFCGEQDFWCLSLQDFIHFLLYCLYENSHMDKWVEAHSQSGLVRDVVWERWEIDWFHFHYLQKRHLLLPHGGPVVNLWLLTFNHKRTPQEAKRTITITLCFGSRRSDP